MGDGLGSVLPLANILDPILDDNGGPTLTHALIAGSPAIDAGDPAIAFDANDFDQRGAPFVRVDGAAIDIGAVESQCSPADLNASGVVGCHDVDALVPAILAGENPPTFDLTGDGIVDRDDFGQWLILAGLENRGSRDAYPPGDGKVPRLLPRQRKRAAPPFASRRWLCHHCKRSDLPKLAEARFKGKACIANPLFGTTSMHAAALFQSVGDDDAKKCFQSLVDNDVKILSSNGEVR